MALTSPESWGGGRWGHKGANPFPSRQRPYPPVPHPEHTNKTAAPPQRCWCQAFIVQLHLKSLPRPRRGEAAAAWLPGWREGKKTLLLWANEAVGGWVHARVGQRGALQRCALGKPIPSTASPPPPLAAPGGTWHRTSPRMARGQLPSLAGCSEVCGLAGKILC